jgi:hypothetical protein
MPPFRREDFEEIAINYAKMCARTLTHLHVAFVYGRGGMLLGAATNRIGTRSSGAGFSDYTIHAERAALKAVGDTSMLRGATVVVIRVSKHGEIMSSEPCHACKQHLSAAMRKYGLAKVYYS